MRRVSDSGMSVIQRAYKTEPDVHNEQRAARRKHAGAARWAYNRGLARKQEAYDKAGAMPAAIDLRRELNALTLTNIPWMDEVSKSAPQEALRNLDSALAHFCRRVRRKRRGRLRGTPGYPQRKTRTRVLRDSHLTGAIVVFPNALQLPRLGRPRLKERGYPPTDAHMLSAAVSGRAGHRYVTVSVEQELVASANSGAIAGADLGARTLATLSDGAIEPDPRHVRSCLKKLNRLQRAVSRKQNGGCNRKKAVTRLAALHRKAAHQRANTPHQFTSRLAKSKAVVVIEDLNVSGMLKQRHLARAIGDVGFYGFRRRLTYKAAWYGRQVALASRWEPTSKTCSGCGWGNDHLTLTQRTARCQACDLVLDRDLNAAINLVKLAGSSSDSQNACGEDGAVQGHLALVKLSPTLSATLFPMKREPNTLYPLG
jgi:putative transposase